MEAHSTTVIKAIAFYIPTLALLTGVIFMPKDAFASTTGVTQAEFVQMMKHSTANTFVFEPRKLRWKAMNNKGQVIRTGRASGGANYCRDIRRACRTPVGSYRIIGKRGAGCRSSRYPLGGGGAPMPYCMFFSKYYAIHGSYDVPGYNASHGCIRVLPNDAKWLHRNFIGIGTRVIVKPY